MCLLEPPLLPPVCSAAVLAVIVPLRHELYMASNAAAPPPEMASKAMVLATAAAQAMSESDVLALRNAYGDGLACEGKASLVDLSAAAGLSSQGRQALLAAWREAEGSTQEALMDGTRGLSQSDKLVVCDVVDNAAYESLLEEEIASRCPKPSKTKAALPLLQRARERGAGGEAMRAMASTLMHVTAEVVETSTAAADSSTGADGTMGACSTSSAATTDARPVAVAAAAAANAASLAQKLKDVKASQELKDARANKAKADEAARAAAEKWQAATQHKKAALSSENKELKKKLANVKSRLFG